MDDAPIGTPMQVSIHDFFVARSTFVDGEPSPAMTWNATDEPVATSVGITRCGFAAILRPMEADWSPCRHMPVATAVAPVLLRGGALPIGGGRQ
jgi:hypothetical protein